MTQHRQAGARWADISSWYVSHVLQKFEIIYLKSQFAQNSGVRGHWQRPAVQSNICAEDFLEQVEVGHPENKQSPEVPNWGEVSRDPCQ